MTLKRHGLELVGIAEGLEREYDAAFERTRAYILGSSDVPDAVYESEVRALQQAEDDLEDAWGLALEDVEESFEIMKAAERDVVEHEFASMFG